jgi:uncharacterized membrane protein YeaQ/YmgE (transglycosylase-associated protein family)
MGHAIRIGALSNFGDNVLAFSSVRIDNPDVAFTLVEGARMFAAILLADTTANAPTLTPWAFDTLAWYVLSTLTFGLVGIILAIIGFKLFDFLTPGNLEDEIVKKQNLAAAILGAAIVLGICLIVSRAVS